MIDISTLILAATLGFQTGCVASSWYHRRLRDSHDAVRRQYEAQIAGLEYELEAQHRVRRQLQDW